MLDKQKLFAQMQDVIPKYFNDIYEQKKIAADIWAKLIKIPDLYQKLKDSNSNSQIPQWYNSLGQNNTISSDNFEYSVLAVDGSQVYPDRHQGIACYLLNVGTVNFDYGLDKSQVNLNSEPFLISQISNISDLNQEMVNAHRTELEFKIGLKESLKISKNLNNKPFCLLFDGSLIFWHLDSKDKNIRDSYINSYLGQLYQFYLNKIPNVGYISLPKSKELISIFKSALDNKIIENYDNFNSEYLVDADILENFLDINCYSAIFAHNSNTIKDYPDCLKPYFVYINIGSEIARIEFPKWLAQDQNLLNNTLKIILNQANKGNGYPIALSEAHEQAVIKSSDRDIFYQFLNKISYENDQKYSRSSKSLKKRIVPV